MSLGLTDALGKNELNTATAPAGHFARLDIAPEGTAVFQLLVSSARRGQTGVYTLTIQRYGEVKKGK